MANFDFSNLNPGAWFDYPDGGRVCVRAPSDEFMDDVRKKTTKVEVEFKTAKKYGPLQRLEHTDVDTDLMKEMIWDYSIVGWTGFKSGDTDIPCTKENKLKLMKGDPRFYSFIDNCVDFLTPTTEAKAAKAEEERKNSKSGQKG